MAINKNHEFEELDGVKCGIVEKNVPPERVAFLKELLELNGYSVVTVPSPAPKAAPAKPFAEGEMPPPPPPPPPPVVKEEPKKEVIVDVKAATICYGETCHPALVGVGTSRGEFKLTHQTTRDPGYGGDILSFKETSDAIYCIHRVLNVRGQHRLIRLKSKNANDRNKITGGCINVDPAVFDELIKCCNASKIVIR